MLENLVPQSDLVRRMRPREEDMRGFYFRDITAIIHSTPFRRLKHKTQVFIAPRNDHICTRIEHVMHVATISATICKALGLDVDLAWAISLGHDLGHTPFGHVGENVLSQLTKDEGGFNHEIYSLRVVDRLANHGRGLNLTYAVRDGIINHCGEKFEQTLEPDFTIKDLNGIDSLGGRPCTWEAIIMRISDKVAYLGRDFEDAVQLRLIAHDDLPREVRNVLGESNSQIIDAMVNDIIANAERDGTVGFSDDVYHAFKTMKDFNYERIYLNPILADYHSYFDRIMRNLLEYLSETFEKHGLEFERYAREKNQLGVRFGAYLAEMRQFYEQQGEGWHRAVVDYVAGMTDDFALESIGEIMIPKRFETQFDVSSNTP